MAERLNLFESVRQVAFKTRLPYIEAMLGLTEMVAPKNSCMVVANIIDLVKGMVPRPLMLLFEMETPAL